MEDILNRLLITSDPYISSIRKLSQKKLKSLSREAVELLLSPTVTVATGRESRSTINTDSLLSGFDTGSDSDMDSNSDVDSTFDMVSD